jgi:outer membrane protein insertion porin family
MKNRTLRLLPLLIAVCFCVPFLPSSRVLAQGEVSAYEGKRVEDVDFKGLVQSDPLSVKSVVTVKPRALFSQEVIDQNIKALFNLELFENIQVDVIEKGEGVAVTFLFTELPTIRKIEIRGNSKITDRTIKDKILLKEGSVFKEQSVYEDVQAVESFFEERGYPETVVDYEVKESKEKEKKTGIVKNTVDLTFLVDESRKLIVRSINFSGVSAVKIEKLRKLMKTRQRGRWLSPGHLKEDQLELDKIEILKYYGEEGYIDAKIVKVDKTVRRNEEKSRDEMDIVIYIEEGKQYSYGGVEIRGNEIFASDELYPLIKSKPNQIFNLTEFQKGVQSIRNIMADNGYIYYALDVEEKKDGDALTVSFVLSVKENKKAHVENIFVTGNKKTKKFVIDRELQIIPGEIFNSRRIQRSIEKLYNLQYFATVNLDVKPGTELGLVDLIFDVEEQRTGLFTFGLSYSTSGYGLSLFEEVSANNFLGRGLRLYEKVDIGYTRWAVELGLDEPWFLNTPTSAGLTLAFSRTRYGTSSSDNVYTFNEGRVGDGITEPAGELPDGVVYTPNGDGTFTANYTNANTMSYVNQTYKAAVRLGRRIGRFYGLNSELAFSVVRNSSDDTYEVAGVHFGELAKPFDSSLRAQYPDWPWNWKNYLSLTAFRDTRDLSYFATRGTLVSQTVWFYGGPLGGYYDYLRLNTELNVSVKTFWKFVLSARLNFGFIYPWLGLPLNVDENDYIRVDGMNEGRGWQRPSQFTSVTSINGKSEINMSLEHRFPVAERVVWGLTFFDISGVYGDETSPQNFSIDPKDLYYSFGMGVSFLIPGFPVRLYLARRFAYDKTLNKLQFANSQKFFSDWDFVFAVAGFF